MRWYRQLMEPLHRHRGIRRTVNEGVSSQEQTEYFSENFAYIRHSWGLDWVYSEEDRVTDNDNAHPEDIEETTLLLLV